MISKSVNLYWIIYCIFKEQLIENTYKYAINNDIWDIISSPCSSQIPKIHSRPIFLDITILTRHTHALKLKRGSALISHLDPNSIFMPKMDFKFQIQIFVSNYYLYPEKVPNFWWYQKIKITWIYYCDKFKNLKFNRKYP